MQPIIQQRLKYFVYFTAAWFAVMVLVHVNVFEPMADGLRPPDGRLAGYSFEDLSAWLFAMDADERATFLLWHTRILDFVFPFLMMAALFFLLRAILSRFERFGNLPKVLQVAFPIVLIAPYGLFDMLENSLVADLLRGDLALTPAAASLASAYTVLKWSFLAIASAITAALWYAARKNEDTQ